MQKLYGGSGLDFIGGFQGIFNFLSDFYNGFRQGLHDACIKNI
jgi:hypothetical protein